MSPSRNDAESAKCQVTSWPWAPFELVAGKTGSILGERFSSDEFAEEVWRRWRESEGRVAEAFQSLGEELTAARPDDEEIRKFDDTLFARDYESA